MVFIVFKASSIYDLIYSQKNKYQRLQSRWQNRNISKMKTQKNNSQLKDQENCLKRTITETDLSSLINADFKKEIMEILKELRKE